MKIAYLIDLKKALQDIPDEVLEIIGWGVGEDSEGIDMCIWGEEDYTIRWEEYNKRYPQLKDIGKWITNIKKAQSIMDDQSAQFDDMEEPLGSDYKFD